MGRKRSSFLFGACFGRPIENPVSKDEAISIPKRPNNVVVNRIDPNDQSGPIPGAVCSFVQSEHENTGMIVNYAVDGGVSTQDNQKQLDLMGFNDDDSKPLYFAQENLERENSLEKLELLQAKTDPKTHSTTKVKIQSKDSIGSNQSKKGSVAENQAEVCLRVDNQAKKDSKVYREMSEEEKSFEARNFNAIEGTKNMFDDFNEIGENDGDEESEIDPDEKINEKNEPEKPLSRFSRSVVVGRALLETMFSMCRRDEKKDE